MRIAVPVAGGTLSQHFGHCEKFSLIDVDPETRQIRAETEIDAPEHQPGLLPVWLKEQGVTAVIAGGMGARAQTLFEGNAIAVTTGAPSVPARELVQACLDGALVSVPSTCRHTCDH